MNKQLNIYAKKVNGKLEIYSKTLINEWIKLLEEGDDIVIKFNQSKNYKSNRQLRLAYACFRELSSKLGYSVEEIKILMKINQGLCGYNKIEGEEIHFCKSMGDMTKNELSLFIEGMDTWAAQKLGMKLLNNNDISFLNECK